MARFYPLPDNYWTYEGVVGGCPYVAVYTTSGWITLNNILGASEANSSDVYDYYLLDTSPMLLNGKYYRIAITEFENEHDFIDYLALYRIVYPPTFDIAVSPMGEIITYKYPRPPTVAINSKGNNILWDVAVIDNDTYSGFRGDYLELTFRNITPGLIKLLLIADNRNIDYNKPEVYAQLADLIEKKSLVIQIWDNELEAWINISTIIPRNNPYMFGIDLTKYFLMKLAHHCRNIPSDCINMGDKLWRLNHLKKVIRDLIPETLRIRIVFTRPHAIDYIALENTPIEEETNRWRQMKIWKQHLKKVEIPEMKEAKKLLKRPDGKYVEISPGQNITVLFRRDKHKTNQTYTEKLLLIIRGHYKTQTQIRTMRTRVVGWQPKYWQNFVKKIGENCRNYGWVFTHIAGYPLKYISNKKYLSIYNIESQGIKQLLGFLPDIKHYNRIRVERRFYGELEAYKDYPFRLGDYLSSLYADYVIDATKIERATNVILTKGFYDTVASFVISMDDHNVGGFAFNGFSKIVDDSTKGYISTANALEYTRTYIIDPLIAYQPKDKYLVTVPAGSTRIEYYAKSSLIFAIRLVPGTIYFGQENSAILFAISIGAATYSHDSNDVKISIGKWVDINIKTQNEYACGFVWGTFRPIRDIEEKICAINDGYVSLEEPYRDPWESLLSVAGFAASVISFILDGDLSTILSALSLSISYLQLYKGSLLPYVREGSNYANIINMPLFVDENYRDTAYCSAWLRMFVFGKSSTTLTIDVSSTLYYNYLTILGEKRVPLASISIKLNLIYDGGLVA